MPVRWMKGRTVVRTDVVRTYRNRFFIYLDAKDGVLEERNGDFLFHVTIATRTATHFVTMEAFPTPHAAQ